MTKLQTSISHILTIGAHLHGQWSFVTLRKEGKGNLLGQSLHDIPPSQRSPDGIFQVKKGVFARLANRSSLLAIRIFHLIKPLSSGSLHNVFISPYASKTRFCPRSSRRKIFPGFRLENYRCRTWRALTIFTLIHYINRYENITQKHYFYFIWFRCQIE